MSTTTFLVKEETVMVVATEKERGLGVEFQRLRRITGYITGDLKTWNSAKRSEEHDRVKHA
jgi:hypothetical protein